MWFWREVVDDIPLRPENFRILHPEIIHKTGQVLQRYARKQGNVSFEHNPCIIPLRQYPLTFCSNFKRDDRTVGLLSNTWISLAETCVDFAISFGIKGVQVQEANCHSITHCP